MLVSARCASRSRLATAHHSRAFLPSFGPGASPSAEAISREFDGARTWRLVPAPIAGNSGGVRMASTRVGRRAVRELESSLQEFGEFLLRAQLVARPARDGFLSRPASDEPLTDQVRGSCEELERNGGSEDWQVR